MNSASAALVKERCFATAWNTWRRRSAIQGYYVRSGIRGRSPNSESCASRGVRAPSPNSVDDVVDRRLLHFPFAGIPVEAGQGEAMPILIIQLHVITPVVIPRPTRFLAEQRVTGDGLRGQKPVVQLPHQLKLV